MTRRLATCLVSSVIAVAACGKSSGPKGSGDLAGAEASLFKEIPGGNLALFGGNYMKMQNFMSSTMGKAVASMMKDEKAEAWMTCFANFKEMKVAGGLGYAGSAITMRMAFSGIKATDIADCAKKGEFNVQLDPDNKFVAVEVKTAGMTVQQGYLTLPSGSIYSRMTINLGFPPSFTSAPRADLEADAAGAAKSSAQDDKNMIALASKVDRSKTFWFVGTAAGTPLASKIGELYGSIDLDAGLAMDVTVQVTSSADADKVADGVKQAKSMADKMPGDLKDVIEGLDFSRDGDHLRFAAKLSEKQLSNLMSLGAMGGMGMGRHRSME